MPPEHREKAVTRHDVPDDATVGVTMRLSILQKFCAETNEVRLDLVRCRAQRFIAINRTIR